MSTFLKEAVGAGVTIDDLARALAFIDGAAAFMTMANCLRWCLAA